MAAKQEQLQTIRARILYVPSPWGEAELIEDVTKDERYLSMTASMPAKLAALFPFEPHAMASRLGDARAAAPRLSSEEAQTLSTASSNLDLRNPDSTFREALEKTLEEALDGDGTVLIPNTRHDRSNRSGGKTMPDTFWQDVRQLAFYFEENNWQEARRFYLTYGGLGAPSWAGGRLFEGWAWCSGVLGWFREITNAVSALKKKQTERLQERFERKEWYCTGWAQEQTADRNYHLRLPWNTRMTVLDHEVSFPTEPPTGDALYTAMWREIADSVGRELGKIPLVPVVADSRSIEFAFQPEGAFHAAFLQWYFDELAYVTMPICGADGCTNLVPPDRRDYCSRTCQLRQKKRRQRERANRR